MVRKNKTKIKPKNYWGLEHISLIIKRKFRNIIKKELK